MTKQPATDEARDHAEPDSDQAVLPTTGALRPDRSGDGTAESEDLADLAQRAAESPDGRTRPLDFDPPPGKTPEAHDLEHAAPFDDDDDELSDYAEDFLDAKP